MSLPSQNFDVGDVVRLTIADPATLIGGRVGMVMDYRPDGNAQGEPWNFGPYRVAGLHWSGWVHDNEMERVG